MVLTPLRPLAVLAISALAVTDYHVTAAPQTNTVFAEEIARLSEPGGFFDTDNLISNERTYLHALDVLRAQQLSGGVYLGVGPGQNFSYIAHLKPTRAYIIDIRRDNLLAHLLHKALFSLSATRIEYLARLFGRPPPDDPDEWRSVDVERLTAYIDETEVDQDAIHTTETEVSAELSRYRVTLSSSDRSTISRFHRTFIRRGLDLRFRSLGRPPRPHYPTYRDLLVATDRQGTRSSYLAEDGLYQFVRSLQLKDLIVPVVGDLAGDHALRAIGEAVAARGETISAFYTSNVEFYLFQRGRAGRYLDNLATLPRDANSVVIRSVFGRMGQPLSPNGSFSYSTPVVQQLEDLVDGFSTGRYGSYWDVVR